MLRRGQWMRVGIATALAGLLAGRWLAVASVDRWWLESLGVAVPHAEIISLSRTLGSIAFLAALTWCAGNLLLVYRAIGSVHVPRRVGNIEIVEAVPKRWLLIGAWVCALLLAIALSRGSSDWWRLSAPSSAAEPLGLTDPILGRDYAYYLFVLPWERTLLGFAMRLTGVMLAIVIALYAAVGGIRWADRQLAVSEVARSHLAGLLALFALALFFGYRIEPAEYVGGAEEVPVDALLQSVRIPVSRLLSGVALVTCAASATWIWVPRTVIPLGAWGLLAAGSFVGHYIAPAFAASVGDPERRALRFVDARAVAEREAFGLNTRDTVIHPAPAAETPDLLARLPAIEQVPLWDGLVVTSVLERVAKRGPAERFYDASLTHYLDATGRRVPVYLAAREIDLNSAREFDRDITWDEVHLEPYAFARGAVAIAAHRVSDAGLPLYVRDLRRADSLSVTVAELALSDSAIVFAPAATEFAVVPAGSRILGAPVGGLLRRLALAWTLQSPQLFSSTHLTAASRVIWRRAVADRLAGYAPFAHFGAAYPVVADQRLYWLSAGYVAGATFPLARRAQWRGQTLRYLRAGFVGVVEAATGRTAVYQHASADPLSALWAKLAPGLVQPAESLPGGLRSHVMYPPELFQVQSRLIHESEMGVPEAVRPALARARARAQSAAGEPYWWIDPPGGLLPPVVTRRSVMERGEPAAYAAILDGRTDDGGEHLVLTRFAQLIPVPALSRVFGRPASAASAVTIQGTPRVMVFGDGALTLQVTYTSPSPPDVPRLSDVAVGWGSAVGTGSTVAIALARVQAAARLPALGADEWAQARRRFEEMDDARRSGDWTAFGQAYEELRKILGVTRDST